LFYLFDASDGVRVGQKNVLKHQSRIRILRELAKPGVGLLEGRQDMRTWSLFRHSMELLDLIDIADAPRAPSVGEQCRIVPPALPG
jgi:hypothetical protein